MVIVIVIVVVTFDGKCTMGGSYTVVVDATIVILSVFSTFQATQTIVNDLFRGCRVWGSRVWAATDTQTDVSVSIVIIILIIIIVVLVVVDIWSRFLSF